MVALQFPPPVRATSQSPRPGQPPSPGRALTWMSISLMLAVFPAFFFLPLWGPLFFLSCATWRWWIERRQLPLPNKWVRAALFSGACIFIVAIQRLDGSTSALAFLLVLVSLKVLELDNRRDYIVTALLGYFLVLSGFFFNQSLLLAVYTLTALIVNTFALAMACGAAPARPSMRLALSLCVQTLPIVVILFIFFPRIEGQFLLFSSRNRTGQAGMSDRLNPGEMARLAENEDTAFRAEIPAEYAVAARDLYWRGPVLAQCNGLAWSAVPLQLDPDFPPAAIEAAEGVKLVPQRITLEAHQNRWLFALDRPVASPTKDTFFAAGGSLEHRRPVTRKLLYNVTSRVATSASPLPSELAPVSARYLQLPRTLSPRVRALAESWRKAVKRGDGEIVVAGLAYFRANNFSYTLSPGEYTGSDPLDDFLFNRRHGFCEHFAASFSTLMRAAGVPSRVILGYQGGRLNWMGSHLRILQSDAHAWSEVWLTGRGWVRVDPTAMVAPERVSLGADSFNALSQLGTLTATERLQELFRLNNPTGLRWAMKNISMAWDTLDLQWNLRVIGYNFDAQGDMMRDLGLGQFGIFGGAMGLLLGLGISAGMFALFLYLRSRSVERPNARASALQKLYARFCRTVARAGGPERALPEGPLDFAARASLALPGSADSISQITHLYIDAHYRRPDADPETGIRAFREAVRAFRPERAQTGRKNFVSSAASVDKVSPL